MLEVHCEFKLEDGYVAEHTIRTRTARTDFDRIFKKTPWVRNSKDMIKVVITQMQCGSNRPHALT